MDRNPKTHPGPFAIAAVALRKESVDRNRRGGVLYSHAGKVALRKESVDRNIKLDVSYNIKETSLSARRAWIEIRNLCRSPQATSASLSARRAWIEIWASGRRGTGAGVALRKESVDRNRDRGPDTGIAAVALRKESVDRNALRACAIACMVCRSPQGERG